MFLLSARAAHHNVQQAQRAPKRARHSDGSDISTTSSGDHRQPHPAKVPAGISAMLSIQRQATRPDNAGETGAEQIFLPPAPPGFSADPPCALIARGGQGQVYRVEDMAGESYVLKTFSGAHALENTKRELAANQQLPRSELFPRCHGLYFIHNKRGLLFDYIEGSTLDIFLRDSRSAVFRGEWSTGQMDEWIRHAIDSLLNACVLMSRHGVAHRDLKPRNIIVDASGALKVCDLGLAEVHHGRRPAVAAEVANTQGTAGFMGPERLSVPAHIERDMLDSKTAAEIDHASDVFALGSIFYALLQEMHGVTSAIARNADATPDTPAPLDEAARRRHRFYASAREAVRNAERHASDAAPEQRALARAQEEARLEVLRRHGVPEPTARAVLRMTHALAAQRPAASELLASGVFRSGLQDGGSPAKP